jgi:ribosomal protein S19
MNYRVFIAAIVSIVWLIYAMGDIGIIGWVIGYMTCLKLSAPSTGQPNIIETWLRENYIIPQTFTTSLRLKLKSYKSKSHIYIHIHHWIYLLILSLFAYTNINLYFLSAVALGGAVQGLIYDDWYRVLWVDI